MSERFTFGIPLVARAVANDWALVERLLALTLRSVLAQTDPDFDVVLAAHEAPAPWRIVEADTRFTLLHADWPPAPPTVANDDGGAKKWLVKQHVRNFGGGLLMFLDADDWVARNLVAAARKSIGREHVGGLVENGIALDWRSLRAARFPMRQVFDGGFADLCGSSTIARLVPGSDDPLLLDPHATLGSHHEWRARAAALGAELARLPVAGAYLVGTGENHSERQGPFAAWRRAVTDAVRREGTPLDDALAEMFGQNLAELQAGEGR